MIEFFLVFILIICTFHLLMINTAHGKLEFIIRLLKEQAERGRRTMKELDDLAAEVAANTDAEQSAVVLLDNLHNLLVAAGTDPAKLQALTAQLATSKDALAAAIVANTPAAETPAVG